MRYNIIDQKDERFRVLKLAAEYLHYDSNSRKQENCIEIVVEKGDTQSKWMQLLADTLGFQNKEAFKRATGSCIDSGYHFLNKPGRYIVQKVLKDGAISKVYIRTPERIETQIKAIGTLIRIMKI